MPHATFDFESYSEAGYVWNPATGKYGNLPGAAKGSKKGLPVIGAAKYSEDPSTEVLVLNYDLNDGHGVRQWYQGWPAPQPLFDYLARGGTLEAHNLPFERWLWLNVCHRRYGWPDLEQYEAQLFCSMAKCRAYAYPPSLDQATKIAGVSEKKDPEGAALMKRFSMPQNPTKANGMRRRYTYADDPEGFMRYTQGYGGQDVIAEHSLSQAVPEMIPIQRDYYRLDQRINRRGVHMDMRAVNGAIGIIEQAFAKYDAELQQITGGIKSTELAKLKGWCAAWGYNMPAMDEEAIDTALKDPNIPPSVAHVLRLRQAIGSASVKKVFAIRNQLTAAGRLVDLFTFHGARTGRPTGNGPQPTNLPKAGPDVWKCECKRHYHHAMTQCPWCGSGVRLKAMKVDGKHCEIPWAPGTGSPREWNPDAAEDAISLVYLGDIEILEFHFGEAMLTLAGCMRGMFDAAPGHDLVSSDFTAIEAVVLACMAGEQWRIDLFRNKGKIYEASGARVEGLQYDNVVAYAAANGKHHPARQVGKTCLSPDTQILTDSGWLAIVDVRLEHKLWDGEEWVSHEGLIAQGQKQVIALDGVKMTPDHKINCDGFWTEARLLSSNESMLCRALATGTASLRSWAQSTPQPAAFSASASIALAVPAHTLSTSTTCDTANRQGVTSAPNEQPQTLEKCIGATQTQCQMTSIAGACSIGSPRQSDVAPTPKTKCTQTTAAEVSTSAPRGEQTNALSCSTSKTSQGGTTPRSKWTGSTAIVDTGRTTCVSSAVATTQKTNEKCLTSKPELMSLSDVYDIANAGPRTRFTIKTDSGALVVHNCELALGYAGWVGAWKAFDASGSRDDAEIKKIILAWREASPAIVEFWGGQIRDPWGRATPELYGVEGHFIWHAINPGAAPTEYRGLTFHAETYQLQIPEMVRFVPVGEPVWNEQAEEWTEGPKRRVVDPPVNRSAVRVFITLPSGRQLTYHDVSTWDSGKTWSPLGVTYWGYNTNPKNGPPGWIAIDTWGGRLVENIIQAIANDILRFSSHTLEANGYPVVLHVYDEIVSEVPLGFGSVKEFERHMSTLPGWAVCDDGNPWPIFVDGGWRGKRYRKG